VHAGRDGAGDGGCGSATSGLSSSGAGADVGADGGPQHHLGDRVATWPGARLPLPALCARRHGHGCRLLRRPPSTYPGRSEPFRGRGEQHATGPRRSRVIPPFACPSPTMLAPTRFAGRGPDGVASVPAVTPGQVAGTRPAPSFPRSTRQPWRPARVPGSYGVPPRRVIRPACPACPRTRRILGKTRPVCRGGPLPCPWRCGDSSALSLDTGRPLALFALGPPPSTFPQLHRYSWYLAMMAAIDTRAVPESSLRPLASSWR
jgi:hypothetical protein